VSYPIRSITGIGPAMAAKLRAERIRTTEGLLEASKTFKERKILAEKLGVEEQTVLRWANLADRMRIKGVREPYAELLKDAGVDTVRELKYRNPGRLAEAMATANAKRKRVDQLPTTKRVEHWIADAKKLTPKISY
jgi:predicted flap endonuclease-1-like 5' DNA nuclease